MWESHDLDIAVLFVLYCPKEGFGVNQRNVHETYIRSEVHSDHTYGSTWYVPANSETELHQSNYGTKSTWFYAESILQKKASQKTNTLDSLTNRKSQTWEHTFDKLFSSLQTTSLFFTQDTDHVSTLAFFLSLFGNVLFWRMCFWHPSRFPSFFLSWKYVR